MNKQVSQLLTEAQSIISEGDLQLVFNVPEDYSFVKMVDLEKALSPWVLVFKYDKDTGKLFIQSTTNKISKIRELVSDYGLLEL